MMNTICVNIYADYLSLIRYKLHLKTNKILEYFFLQSQNLDLSNVTQGKILEFIFQSPENSISQDEGPPNGKTI